MPLTAADIGQRLGLTVETLDRLRAYVDLLGKWNRRINLVGSATLPDVWRRHILDSAQILPLLPPSPTVVDLGSGAGLPGLILAILGVPDIHLIEADIRKGAFLREAARLTGTVVTVHTVRIEAAPAIAADVVTARALAPVSALIEHAARFLKPAGKCIFLKGSRVADELTAARKSWHMVVSEYPSASDPSGVVVEVEQLSRERH